MRLNDAVRKIAHRVNENEVEMTTVEIIRPNALQKLDWIPDEVYCDAGILTYPEKGIKQGASPIGHSWAFIWRNEKEGRYLSRCGVNLTLSYPSIWMNASKYFDKSRTGKVVISYLPENSVGNNTAELIAACNALCYLPEGWAGNFYCDNEITIGRLFGFNGRLYKFEVCPPWLEQRAREVRERLGDVKATLLDGHPNAEQLEEGIGKRGNPVSVWNCECDALCNLAKNGYMNFYKEYEKGNAAEGIVEEPF